MLIRMKPKDPFYDPKFWRSRAEATRTKAASLSEGKPKDRLLKVAEEYDKLARRAEEWPTLKSDGDADTKRSV
ncbi:MULTISPECIES: hypothetical protein [Bradyrhizobium]|uniref:hypothetical protein n=1 Tax=Bradyrhizobium TaxID=374 RepID=UPI001AD7A44F|nr:MULTISPECIES: hypothetical protein [Bradyrhizobium]MBO4227553.1 hypothetical protein [Bradyrhizobium neotropicale]MCA1455124.1 hypothetical protein [Bradyrhizobium sp. BRP22]